MGASESARELPGSIGKGDSVGELPILVEPEGRVLRITLNRPGRRNAVDLPMAEGLAAALDRLDADDGLSVGVIAGAGRGFCSGLDMNAYEESGELPVVPGRGFAGISERSARKPLVAAVEGFAIAGGLEIAFACDVIVAANDATFGLPEVRRGLIASGGGLLGLTRRTSLGAALELALTGRPIGAVRAQRLGIVDTLTAPGRAAGEAMELAKAIAAGAPTALAATKAILCGGWGRDEESFRELQSALAAEVLASEDAAEGIRAFNERRPPSWRGR